MINEIKKRAKINEENKTVVLSLDDFKALIESLQMCKENENKLKEGLMFLNQQIADYNKKG